MNRNSDNYRLLIENMPDAFAYHQIITDDDGTPVDYIFLDVNSAFEEMTGLTRNDVIGKKGTQVHSTIKKSALDWIGVYGKVAQGGEAIRFEHYFEPAKRWYEISSYSDELGSFVAIFRDISKHKNMETDLSNMTSKLKAIIDNSPLLISEFKPDGQYLMGNKAVGDLLNLETSEIAGCYFEDFLPPETVNLFNKRINAVVSNKKPIRVDDQITVEDKSFYYMTTLFPLCDSTGKVSSIGSIAHDITDRIEAEEALRESLALFNNLVARIPVGVYVCHIRSDKRMEFDYVSDRWCAIHQLHREDVLFDATIANIQAHPDERENFLKLNQEALLNQRPFLWEGRFTIGDGELRWLRIESTPVMLDNGDIRWFGVTQDITERKQIEEALKLQASERAAVDAFTNSVSHDLQAPLRRIEGFSEALLEECSGELSELARDYLQRITRQIGSMKERTDALLQLSRVVSHGITREEVNLSDLARAYLEKLCYAEPNRLVEKVIAPEMEAMGDFKLLSIVLENLLHNAWKYTAGEEKARIECGSILKDGLTIYFVKDNGIGFDPQRADEIFDPFKKLHSETDYPGIGIGLNLGYRIITRHGGKIWAEGEEGKGACFYFTLP